MNEEIAVHLTSNEINRLTAMLGDSARWKKKLARTAHRNDREAVEASAMRDYELRSKLIAAKPGGQPYDPHHREKHRYYEEN